MRTRILLLVFLFAAFIFSTAQPSAAQIIDQDLGPPPVEPTDAVNTLVEQRLLVQACVPIHFGNPPTSGTYTPGEVDCYTFVGTINAIIRVQVVRTTGNFNPDIEIIRPGGSTLCDTIFAELTCTVDTNGTHQILVTGIGSGAYKIHVQRLNNPVACPKIRFGNPPTAGVYAAGEVDCYNFPGKINDKVRVTVTPTSGNFNPDIEIIRPNGTTLCDTIFSEITCDLNANGPHRILVDGLGTGNYRITLTCLSGSCILPAAPILRLPRNNSTVTDSTPRFCWNKVTGATQYRLQVDNNSNFSSPMIDVTRTTLCVNSPNALGDRTYYWRVRGKNAAGLWGSWSARWSFKLDAVP